MKKLIMLTVAVMMVIGLLGGCSKKDGSKDTITILYPGDESERMSEFMSNEFAE